MPDYTFELTSADASLSEGTAAPLGCTLGERHFRVFARIRVLLFVLRSNPLLGFRDIIRTHHWFEGCKAHSVGGLILRKSSHLDRSHPSGCRRRGRRAKIPSDSAGRVQILSEKSLQPYLMPAIPSRAACPTGILSHRCRDLCYAASLGQKNSSFVCSSGSRRESTLVGEIVSGALSVILDDGSGSGSGSNRISGR